MNVVDIAESGANVLRLMHHGLMKLVAGPRRGHRAFLRGSLCELVGAERGVVGLKC